MTDVHKSLGWAIVTPIMIGLLILSLPLIVPVNKVMEHLQTKYYRVHWFWLSNKDALFYLPLFSLILEAIILTPIIWWAVVHFRG
jgi:hypothetical protein